MARRLRARRAAAWAAVVLGVTLLHAVATREIAQSRSAWGEAAEPPIQRIEVAFVRELVPTAPPAAPPVRMARSKPRAAAPAPEAASAPEPAASEPAAEPLPEASAVTEAEAPPELTASAAVAEAPASAASEPGAPGFEWPPSTRLSYVLKGWWEGELHGSARVQWVRLAERYQVQLDVDVSVVSRRMTSDGELTPQGLRPRRYDEETRFLGQGSRRATLHFEPDRIVTAAGATRDTWAGIQDTASQFVQLTWLFTTRPELLRRGSTITLPLALPRRSKLITFDVAGEERLDTAVGPVDAVRLTPRAELRPGNDISAEVWFAPSLQYLPVRIRLKQGDINADLTIQSLPLQAEPPAPAR